LACSVTEPVQLYGGPARMILANARGLEVGEPEDRAIGASRLLPAPKPVISDLWASHDLASPVQQQGWRS
jgi:hypothetical protein